MQIIAFDMQGIHTQHRPTMVIIQFLLFWQANTIKLGCWNGMPAIDRSIVKYHKYVWPVFITMHLATCTSHQSIQRGQRHFMEYHNEISKGNRDNSLAVIMDTNIKSAAYLPLSEAIIQWQYWKQFPIEKYKNIKISWLIAHGWLQNYTKVLEKEDDEQVPQPQWLHLK